ncbi:trypsin-like serine protease [Paenibacillus sp. Leaf72]|uniref:trypsin-like serine protease n=1 Tax=Paenibacillus sp. Leaf72 TaxID=1736234 RepID=UPI0006FEA1E3|nr:trypsin-like serine protease [Paenibacillus sp. Leaf72]KQO18076.1 hypothetical protein ASF12_05390 [Paenibacillus sp. Leaf72]
MGTLFHAIQRAVCKLEIGTGSGTGVLIQMQEQEYLYLLTAKHCLFDKKPSAEAHGNIKLLIDGVYESLELGSLDRILYSNEKDIAIIVISKHDGRQVLNKIPKLKIINPVYTENDCLFRGFPYPYNQQNTDRGINITNVKYSDENIVTTTTALDTVDSDSNYNCKGFSGGGVFCRHDEEYYLTGILYEIEEPFRQFPVYMIKYFNDLLVQHEYLPIQFDSLESPLKRKYNPQWFLDRIKRNIANADERYSEKLHVEMQMSELIDAIELNDKFLANIIAKCEQLQEGYKHFDEIEDSEVNCTFERLLETKEQLSSHQRIATCLSDLVEIVKELKHFVDLYLKQQGRGYFFIKQVDEMLNYVQDNVFKAAVNPYILISGAAGVGKSHFMAHNASRLFSANKVSLYVLGQLLIYDDTINNQLKRQLEIDCDIEEFLELFNKYGAEQNERVVIFIDAINEAQVKRVWKNSIGGFVETLRKYRNIALVMSLRNTYEADTIPTNFFEAQKVLRVELSGFDDIDEAVRKYFNHYQVPFTLNDSLRHEFKNPLFLKLYCSINRPGQTIDPMKNIFDNYFDNVESRLRERIEGYPLHASPLHQALSCFINKLLIQGGNYLLYEEIYLEVKELVKKYSLSVINFFDELIKEHLVTVSTMSDKSNNKFTIAYLAFEIFGEHIAAKRIVEENSVEHYTSNQELEAFFSDENPYAHVLIGDGARQGIYNALAVLIPDISPPLLEMYDWPEHVVNNKHIDLIQAYYHSLKWRRPEAITGISHSLIVNEVFVLCYQKPRYMYDFWDEVLKYTLDERHYYNADFLYRQLIQLRLEEFNSFWTVYVSKDFDENDCFKQIMNWVWKRGEESSVFSRSKLLLLGMNITWFLASTDEKVRDLSIKTLVKLFKDSGDELICLLEKFSYVKDLYILEGLLCAVYGCVLNNTRSAELDKIGEYVYKQYFNGITLIPHLTIRGYLVNIIEYTIWKGFGQYVDVTQIRLIDSGRDHYYEVCQDEIDILKLNSSEQHLERLDPYGMFSDVDDFDLFYLYQNRIIAQLESLYTGIKVDNSDRIDFQLENVINHILPDHRENLTRMVIKEIFKAGYNYVRFGEFDIGISDMRPKRVNQLGQKYEWIALNKILTIYFESNPVICETYYSDGVPESFEGVWQMGFFRKIDPSIDYHHPFDVSKSYEISVVSLDLLLEKFLRIVEQDMAGITWLAVNAIHYRIDEHYHLTEPFLLAKDEVDSFRKFLMTVSTINERPLEDLYIKEIYWSQAYKSFLNKIHAKRESGFLQKKITDTYTWDISDGAMGDYISFSILSPMIIKELGILQSDEFLTFEDENGVCICRSLYEESYEDKLLLRKDFISDYLLQTESILAWPISIGKVMKHLITFDGMKYEILDV